MNPAPTDEYATDEVDEEYLFTDAIVDLVLFCAGSDPLAWRAIWTTWLYSDVVEYSVYLTRQYKEMDETLKDLKEPQAMMIYLLMKR